MVDVAKKIIDTHGSLDINNQAAQGVGSQADEGVVLVQTTYVFDVPNSQKLTS